MPGGRGEERVVGLVRGCGQAWEAVVRPALDRGATSSETGATWDCRMLWVGTHTAVLHPQWWPVAPREEEEEEHHYFQTAAGAPASLEL